MAPASERTRSIEEDVDLVVHVVKENSDTKWIRPYKPHGEPEQQSLTHNRVAYLLEKEYEIYHLDPAAVRRRLDRAVLQGRLVEVPWREYYPHWGRDYPPAGCSGRERHAYQSLAIRDSLFEEANRSDAERAERAWDACQQALADGRRQYPETPGRWFLSKENLHRYGDTTCSRDVALALEVGMLIEVSSEAWRYQGTGWIAEADSDWFLPMIEQEDQRDSAANARFKRTQDNIDRALASHLVEQGVWLGVPAKGTSVVARIPLAVAERLIELYPPRQEE